MNTDQLIASLSEEASPVRPATRPKVRGLQWVVGYGLYIAALCYSSGLRPDIALKLAAPLFALEIGLLIAIVVSCAFSAATLSFPDMYQQRWTARAPIGFFGAFIGIMTAAYIQENPATPMPASDFDCTLCILKFTAIPAAIMLFSMRRYASTHYLSAGSVAILAAFAAGALVLRLTEPTDSIAHMLGYHYLPMIGAGILGLGLGRLLLKW